MIPASFHFFFSNLYASGIIRTNMGSILIISVSPHKVLYAVVIQKTRLPMINKEFNRSDVISGILTSCK